MNKRWFIIVSIAMFSVAVFSKVNAQPSAKDKADVKAFVQKFYDWYVVLYTAPVNKKNPVCSCEIPTKQHPEYFDPGLRKALMADFAAQAKVKGEIAGLDSDPFLGGQDIGRGYKTGNVKCIGNKFLVDIHDIEKGKSEKETLAAPVAVVAEVAKSNEHFVFTNFIF